MAISLDQRALSDGERKIQGACEAVPFQAAPTFRGSSRTGFVDDPNPFPLIKGGGNTPLIKGVAIL